LSYFIHLPMKMELIEGSETSAISIVTPGNYPKENILHLLLYYAYVRLNMLRGPLCPSSGAALYSQPAATRVMYSVFLSSP